MGFPCKELGLPHACAHPVLYPTWAFIVFSGMNMMKDADELERIELAMKEVDELIEGLLDSCPAAHNAKRDIHPVSKSYQLVNG